MDRHETMRRIVDEALAGCISLPSEAAVALRVQDALNDPSISLSNAAKAIQAQPVLAARIVAVANSTAYRDVEKEVTDLRSAIKRVGLRTAGNLVAAHAICGFQD